MDEGDREATREDRTKSSTWTRGKCGEAIPLAEDRADMLARLARSKAATTPVAATTAIKMPGTWPALQ
jgi:hypothetical protein